MKRVLLTFYALCFASLIHAGVYKKSISYENGNIIVGYNHSETSVPYCQFKIVAHRGSLNFIRVGNYASGAVRFVVEVENARLNGLFLAFHENGKLFISAHFKEDLLHGALKEFNKEGVLAIEKQFLNGEVQK